MTGLTCPLCDHPTLVPIRPACTWRCTRCGAFFPAWELTEPRFTPADHRALHRPADLPPPPTPEVLP